MFRHIRTKFAAALAVPLAVLVGLAALGVLGSLHRQRSARSQQATAAAALSPTGLVSALQNERNEASLQLLGLDQSVSLGVRSNAQARAATALSSEQFRLTLAGSSVASSAYDPALAGLDQLGAIRRYADGFAGARSLSDPAATAAATSVYERYSAVVQRFLDAASRVAPTIADTTLRDGAEILDASLRQSEAQAQVVHDVFDATFVGGLAGNPPILVATSADLGAYQAWTSRLASLSVAPYESAVATMSGSAATGHFVSLVQSYLSGARPDLIALLSSTAAGGSSGSVTPYKAATIQVASLSSARAGHLLSAASRQLWLFVGLGLLALIFGLAVILRASHSISRPLVRLARQAEELADHRLGAAVATMLDGGSPSDDDLPRIHAPGRDEVASVARAIGAVQDSALALATEQSTLRRNLADALTNLGRRNQNLVTRQLDYITAVENGETDPEKLDHLFKLDHLATRMRRNAESLLVLGGSEPSRQWSPPVQGVDVVRSALSEVEDFRRVRLGALQPVDVAGTATSDIAHLLAELLENALTNSPPTTPVVVDGCPEPNGYRLRILDRGIGMSNEALEQANLRLSGADSFLDRGSRNLGLYVAGRLAARHGITISLRPGEDAGLVAEVQLPFGVVSDTGEARSAADTLPPDRLHEVSGPAHSPGAPESTDEDGAESLAALLASLEDRVEAAAALDEPTKTEAPELPTLPVRSIAGVSPSFDETAVTVLSPPADPASDFDGWLNSRLDQLEQLSLEQAVTADTSPPSWGNSAADSGEQSGDDGDVAGLPRRLRHSADYAPSTGLLRRAPQAGATEPDGVARVNSSLFRYLAAVDPRPSTSE